MRNAEQQLATDSHGSTRIRTKDEGSRLVLLTTEKFAPFSSVLAEPGTITGHGLARINTDQARQKRPLVVLVAPSPTGGVLPEGRNGASERGKRLDLREHYEA